MFTIFSEFLPLNELIDGLSYDMRARWERLWTMRRSNRIHPLIYPHPVTGTPVSPHSLTRTSVCPHPVTGTPVCLNSMTGTPACALVSSCLD